MKPLYSNNQTQQIDQMAADALGIDSFELMQKAGAAVFEHVKSIPRVLVITGPGNNGGDGFVVAELARKNDQQVCVLALRPIEELTGDALQAANLYQGEFTTFAALSVSNGVNYDGIIDAVFGTGLKQQVSGQYRAVIEWINQQGIPVIAIDIPSGLNGDTGVIEGYSVKADQTIAVLARNSGLHTMDGKYCCGDVVLESLGVSQSSYSSVSTVGQLMNSEMLSIIEKHRHMNSHKGDFGHVLSIGGQAGMMGAVLLAAKAVMKSGAGLCTVITDASHVDWVPLYAPELMTFSFAETTGESRIEQQFSTQSADVVLLGMGLGQSQWSKSLFNCSIALNIPLVLDADGLNLLNTVSGLPEHLQVITPHPKEAAQLLTSSTATIQSNRWQAVRDLAVKYNCVAVLKGSGTLISDGVEVWCCPYGNSNLATAGSGDVLAGLVAGLLAQGHSAEIAAQCAVVWHALAGENNPHGYTMTASDLLDTLHLVVCHE